MELLLIGSLLQVFLVAMTIHIGQHRMAPGQWMPLGIAAMGMVCAATLLA